MIKHLKRSKHAAFLHLRHFIGIKLSEKKWLFVPLYVHLPLRKSLHRYENKKRQKMSSVLPFLKKQPGKDGRCKLYIRINDGQRRTYLQTDIKLKVSEWNKKDHVIKSSHPYHVILNNELKRKILDIETAIITNGSIKKVLKQHTFKDYTEQLIKNWGKLKKESTLNQFRGEIGKMELFRSNVLMSEITPLFLNEYQTYMVNTLCNIQNTLAKTMKILKTVVLSAHREGIISSNPFVTFKPPRFKPGTRVFLSDEELQDLEDYLSRVSSAHILTAGWYFLFGCYSGLRFQDMCSFNPKKHIQNGRLHLYTGKTGSPISIKIGPKLDHAIKKISKLPKLYTNTQANTAIKSIMIEVGINKPISFHCSRHTFAIRCAAAGISPEITGRALGHHDLKTTAIYYKIADKRMDEEMEKLG